MSIHGKTYLAIILGSVAWCSTLVLTPLLAGSSAGTFLYSFFHSICHQIDQRSFHVMGQPLAVCSRCSAIYFAFLVGTVLYPFIRSVQHPATPSRWLLIGALLPMVLDVFTGLLGMHEITNTTRTLTGSVFGLLLPFIIIPIAMEAIQQLHGLFRARKELHNA